MHGQVCVCVCVCNLLACHLFALMRLHAVLPVWHDMSSELGLADPNQHCVWPCQLTREPSRCSEPKNVQQEPQGGTSKWRRRHFSFFHRTRAGLLVEESSLYNRLCWHYLHPPITPHGAYSIMQMGTQAQRRRILNELLQTQLWLFSH